MAWSKNHQKNYLKTTLAVLAILLFYWPVSFGVYSMKWDILNWFFPMRQLVGEILQAHLVPLWNPYINLGYPLGIDPQSGSLYPLTWAIGYFLGYSVYVIGLEFVLHTIFGFWGFKKLGKTLGWSLNTALVVGLLYAGSGFMVGNSQHLTYIISAAWIPWILHYYYQLWNQPSARSAVGLSLAMMLLLTGGYPAFFLTIGYTLMAIFIWMMVKKMIQKKYAFCKQVFVFHSLAVVLFLFQSLCFIRFFLESLPLINRTKGLTLAQVQLVPFSPQGLLTFLFPFMASPDVSFWQTDISMVNVYFGLGAFLLVLTQILFRPSKKVLSIFGIGLIFMGISFGDFFFLRSWLYHTLPFMDMFKYPALFRLFFILLFLILAGIGLERLRKDYSTKSVSLTARTSILKEATRADRLEETSSLQKEKAINFSKQIQWAAIAATIISVFLFIYTLSQVSFQWPEAFSAAAFHQFAMDRPVAVRLLMQLPIQIAFLLVFIFLIKKKSIKFIYLLFVLDIFMSVQFNSFSTIICEAPTKELQNKLDTLPKNFLSVTPSVFNTGHLGDNRYYPIFNNHSMFRKDIAKNGYNNLQLRAYAKFHSTEKFKEYLDHPPFYSEPESSLELRHFTPNELVVQTSGTQARQLRFSQINYPGWQVTIDDYPATLAAIDAPILAVDLAPGTQEVRFKFMPKGYSWSLGISMLCSLSALLWLIITKK